MRAAPEVAVFFKLGYCWSDKLAFMAAGVYQIGEE